MKTRIVIASLLLALPLAPRALAGALSDSEQASVRQQVHDACATFLAKFSTMDVDAAWAFNAATPDYVFAGIDGRVMDAAAARENWDRAARLWAEMSFTTDQERIVVLGADTALHVWSGTSDATTRTGRTFRFERVAMTTVWRRTDDGWRMISMQQAGFLPRPLTPEPPASATTDPAQAGAEAAVRSADAACARAIAAKSVDQVAACFDSEALMVGSAMPRARGLPAYRDFWTRMFARPEYRFEWFNDRVVVTDSGNLACAVGHWASHDAHGPALAVWRKQPDGAWKVLIDAAWFEGPVVRRE